MEELKAILKLFPHHMQEVLAEQQLKFEKLEEIRLRVEKPLFLRYAGQEWVLKRDAQGGWTLGVLRENVKDQERCYVVSEREIRDVMEAIGRYSLYAFEEELRRGFLTIPGGHRVGVAGKVVAEGDLVRSIKYISHINIRLSHQVRGCGEGVMPYLRGTEGQLYHTLLVSPPGCGKTTLLRDLIRQISDGGATVGVVDERSEIAGCYQGIPANDLGVRTDVLDCCPKAEGMMMLIRSMAPAVVAVDEIGGREDVDAIRAVLRSGCKLLTTIHGSSFEELRQKPFLGELVEQQVIERYVILGPPHRVEGILGKRGEVLSTC